MDMPDDIRETARLTWRLNPVECKQYIAAALMAERERCIAVLNAFKRQSIRDVRTEDTLQELIAVIRRGAN